LIYDATYFEQRALPASPQSEDVILPLVRMWPFTFRQAWKLLLCKFGLIYIHACWDLERL